MAEVNLTRAEYQNRARKIAEIQQLLDEYTN